MRPAAIRTKRLKRALAHQCPNCRRHWALQLVEHPSGKVVLCRYCGAIRQSLPARELPVRDFPAQADRRAANE